MTQQTTQHTTEHTIQHTSPVLDDLYRAECARLFHHTVGSTPVNAFAILEA